MLCFMQFFALSDILSFCAMVRLIPSSWCQSDVWIGNWFSNQWFFTMNCQCAPNVAAPNVAGAVTPEFRVWSPKKRKKTEKPEFRIWTPNNRKRRKKRKKRKNRNSGSGPLKTGKGGKHGKDGKSGCAQNPIKREENEPRNAVRNFWLQPKRTPEQGMELLAWRSGNYSERKTEPKQGPVLTGHVWCGHVWGARNFLTLIPGPRRWSK